MSNKLSAEEETIKRLMYELDVMRQTVALYGNGFLSYPVLAIGDFRSTMSPDWTNKFVSSFQIYRDSFETRFTDGSTNREMPFNGQTFKVNPNARLHAYRMIVALVQP